MRLILLFGGILVVGFSVFFNSIESCNEAVCASIVSKCMLTQSCKCDLKNCTCCKECFSCLSFLYSECCSCVEMCPKANESDNSLSKKSHVEDLADDVAGLFKALTEEPDLENRWVIFTYPIDFNSITFGPNRKDYMLQSLERDVVTVNCTVAYMTQCMSWNKCKSSCQSMGASSYRWFHDGCCECVGTPCINYGINDSRCPNCSQIKYSDELNEDENDEDDEDVDFGEVDDSVPQEL